MERRKWAHLAGMIKKEIQESYFTLIMVENGDLRVSRDSINHIWSVVTKEMPEYHAILDVVGPLEPGYWLNAYKYVGRKYHNPDILRYVGKEPKPSKSNYRIVGQILPTHILIYSKRPPEMAPDAADFEKCMLAGFYEKVVLCDDGSINVWKDEGRETEKRTYPADLGFKAVLEKHVGPLAPDDIIEFEEIGEYRFVAKKRLH